MKKQLVITIILLFSSLHYSQVIEIERGKIEIIGLKSLTPQALIDSLAKLYPGKPVHACASSMKDDFGFADVSSIVHMMEGRKFYYIVTIIENDSTDNINYLEDPSDTLDVLPNYKEVEEIVSDRKNRLAALLRTYRIAQKGDLDSAKIIAKRFRLDSNTVIKFSNFLQKHQNIEDLNLALWIINNDSNPINNKIALSIIANFDNYDNVWWTLMNLQRRKSHLYMYAMETLNVLSEQPRSIDWSPVVPGIRSILAGTNLFTYWMTLKVLVSTNISPKLADEILKDNKQLLLGYLDIEHEQTLNVVLEFINQLNGNKDKILNQQECKKWLEQM